MGDCGDCVRMMAVVVLLYWCVAATSALSIKKAESGAMVVHQEEVWEIRAYADIYVQLTNDHPYVGDWTAACDQLENIIKSKVSNEEHIAHMDSILLKRVAALRSRLPTAQSTRKKRGLFDFIGNIGSALFGIPSHKDVEDLSRATQQLAGSVDGIVKVEQQIVAKVNYLGHRQD